MLFGYKKRERGDCFRERGSVEESIGLGGKVEMRCFFFKDGSLCALDSEHER